MNYRHNIGMGCFSLVVIYIFTALIGWGFSIYKLVNSDFESPYKREAIYAAGVLFPPSACIIGYLNIKDGKQNEDKN